MRFPERQPDPVADRSMAETVIEDRVAPLRYTAEDAKVGVVTGIEDQPALGSMKCGHLPLRFLQQGVIARQQPGPGAAMGA